MKRCTLSPTPISGLRPGRQEEENEGAGLAPSCSPSQCGALAWERGDRSLLAREAGECEGVRAG
jgi:hypothetical protein